MSKISVNELSGAALNYAVALAEGYEMIDVPADADGKNAGEILGIPGLQGMVDRREWAWPPKGACGHMLKQWAAGPDGDAIIDREKIATEWCWSLDEPCWQARIHQHSPTRAHAEDGATRREAAMRCYCASKLGAEVEIPKELA